MEEAIHANVFVTRIIYITRLKNSLTFKKHNFLFGIGNGENGVKFDNWMD